MSVRIETLKMSDGADVHTVDFAPARTPAAVVQFVHGFGEHVGRYTELAERFNAKNIAFVSHDQRGHGKTQGKRGVSPSYDRLLDDVSAVRKHIGGLYPDTPVILYGHSMGGNIAANYLISRSQKDYACAVIGSPWLRLYHPFPAAVMVLASVLGKLSKNMTVTNKLDLQTLTHDGELVRKTEEDVAYHGNLSFRLFSQITSRGEYAIKNAGLIKLPALLMCAGDDRIVSTPAAMEMAANSGGGLTLKKYDGLYHELHNELEREQIFGDVYDFIAPFCRR